MMIKRGVRARRDGWAEGVKVAVTERDIEILYLVGVCGVVRTRDLARFFFGSRATANDRLRKLYCAGLIEAHIPDLARDNYYTLTPLGRDRVLEAYETIDPDILRVVRKLPAKLDHQLTVTELRLHVALACRASDRYDLGSFRTDADLARDRHAGLLDLIPDCVISVREKATGAMHTFFAEVDLGTEAVTFLVRHKLAAYARHAALGTALYGHRNPLVVLVVPGLRRARNIARLMVDLGVHARVVFALGTMLNESNVLGAAYALPEDLVGADADDVKAIFARRLLP